MDRGDIVEVRITCTAAGGNLAGLGIATRWPLLMVFFAWFISGVASAAEARSASVPEQGQAPFSQRVETTRRTLVLLLDAVPFEAVATAGGEARLFNGFHAPVPLIAAFPSETGVALTGLFEPFGIERPPGYEVRFYDRARGRVRGGGPISYFTIDYPYHHVFDWKLRGLLRKAFAYARPIRYNRLEIDEAIESFLASDKPLFFAYVTSTDASGHAYGPTGLRPMLEHLDAALRRTLMRNNDRPFNVVLLSDHGIGGTGRPLRNIRKTVKRTLRENGWHVRSRLRHPSDVAVMAEGLISSLVVYAQPGTAEGLATLLARVEGVALCAFQDGAGWGIAGQAGLARLHGRHEEGRQLWAYEPESGDPLGYSAVLERLRRDAGTPTQRWFPEDAWFTATTGHRYPDALYRIARSFDLVTNPASAVCSIAPGYVSGAWYTEVASRLWYGPLRWTHGSLERADTAGFLLSDHPAWAPDGPVRFTDALRFLVSSPAQAVRVSEQ